MHPCELLKCLALAHTKMLGHSIEVKDMRDIRYLSLWFTIRITPRGIQVKLLIPLYIIDTPIGGSI